MKWTATVFCHCGGVKALHYSDPNIRCIPDQRDIVFKVTDNRVYLADSDLHDTEGLAQHRKDIKGFL